MHDVDALACECGSRLRFVDLITNPSEAMRLLAERGRLHELQPLPPPCAADPTPGGLSDDFCDPAPLDNWE